MQQGDFFYRKPKAVPCPTSNQIKNFLNRIDIKNPDECWEWKGCVNNQGYGIVKIKKQCIYVHRLSFFLFRNDTLENETVDHLCRNTTCCNPSHLEKISHSENVSRGNKDRNKKEDNDEIEDDGMEDDEILF